jgi:hypothetical protein
VATLVEGTSARVFGTFLLGTRWESAWWSANSLSLVILGPLVVIGLLLVLAVRADWRARVMATSFSILAVIMFAVPAWERGTPYLLLGPSSVAPATTDYWNESRFSVVPVLLMASALAILLASNPPSVRRFGIPIFAVWTLLLVAVCFSQSGVRGQEPSWTSRVSRAAATCTHLSPSSVVTVPNMVGPAPPLFPHGSPNGAGFYPVVVRCSNL